MNSSQYTRSMIGLPYLNHFFVLMFLYFLCFSPLLKFLVFIFQVFESIFASDNSSLQPVLSSVSLLLFFFFFHFLSFFFLFALRYRSIWKPVLSRYLTFDPSVISLQIILWWMSFEQRLFISIFFAGLLFSYAPADMCFSL